MLTTLLSRISLAIVISAVILTMSPMGNTTEATTCPSSQKVALSGQISMVTVCAGQRVYLTVGTSSAILDVVKVDVNSVSFKMTASPSRAVVRVGRSIDITYAKKFVTKVNVVSVRNGVAVVGLSATHLSKPTAPTPIAGFTPDLVVTGLSLNQPYPYGVMGGNILKVTYKNIGTAVVNKPFSLSLSFSPSWVIPELFQPIPFYLDTVNGASSSFLSSVDNGNNVYEVVPNVNSGSGLNAYALAPGQSGEMYVIFQQYKGSLLNNGLSIVATVDSKTEVVELNETNNIFSTQFAKSEVQILPGT